MLCRTLNCEDADILVTDYSSAYIDCARIVMEMKR